MTFKSVSVGVCVSWVSNYYIYVAIAHVAIANVFFLYWDCGIVKVNFLYWNCDCEFLGLSVNRYECVMRVINICFGSEYYKCSGV